MEIKIYKPYTPSIRKKKIINYILLSKKYSEKSLLSNNHRKTGRNNQGKITVRHKGGGHKKLYRSINFKKIKYNMLGRIISIEYDPYRNTFISLVYYENHTLEYMLYIYKLKIGSLICTINNNIINKFKKILKHFKIMPLGCTLNLKYIPIGSIINCLEISPQRGAQIIRSAGTSGKIISREKKYIAIKLASKEIRLFDENCLATIGKIGNISYNLTKSGKAGRSRWLGIRPTVRGSAMNAVDHPHGGGEGKSPIGKPAPKTPWGKIALGIKTRKKKKFDFLILKKK